MLSVNTIRSTIGRTIHRSQVVCFLLFIFVLFALRLCLPGIPHWPYNKKAILTGALLFSFQYTVLWKENRVWRAGNFLFAGLYFSTVLLQLWVGQRLDGRETIDACLSGMATFWGGYFSMWTFRKSLPLSGATAPENPWKPGAGNGPFAAPAAVGVLWGQRTYAVC